MARLTKLRGAQTRAKDVYSPSSDSLATDFEVENRVKQHSAFYHHSRNEFIDLVFTNGDLTSIDTYEDNTKSVLLAKSQFNYTNGNLTSIDRIIYNTDSTIYMHLQKTFNFDTLGNLISIDNTKVV